MASAHFEFPRDDDSNAEFCLAHFTHGQLVDDSGLRFALLEEEANRMGKKRKKRKLVAESTRMTYVASSSGDDVTPTNKNRYMIAVHDPVTQKARLYDASMFFLKPHLPGTDELDAENEPEEQLTTAQKLDQLTSAFGSSKKKRAMESRKKNKLSGADLENAVGAAAQQALKNTDITALQTDSPSESASVIPPYNKEAEKPQDVYSLRSIIPPEELEALQTPAQVFVESDRTQVAAWREENKYPRFVLSQLMRLPVNQASRSQRCSILTYLHYLIHLYQIKVKELRSKDPLPENVPQVVKKYLLDSFTLSLADAKGKAQRCIPARLKDKLASHIFVLALMIEDFALEFTDLQQDLKIGVPKAITYLRNLGCRTSKEKVSLSPDQPSTEVLMAKLSLPLVFPEVSGRTKKGRR